jgi:arginase
MPAIKAVHLYVPYDIGEPAEGLSVPPGTRRVTADLPEGTALERMAVLYDRLAEEVASTAADEVPVVHAPDCMASLGVLAGLQRKGLTPSVVWFDAHGDFNTPDTSPSGYVGGMPLAMAVGRGEFAIADAIGLDPLDEAHVVLVDARDLDPLEGALLAASRVTVTSVEHVAELVDPARPLYVHLDVDVLDARAVHALRYPAEGGPALTEVESALRDLGRRADIAAVCLACTWDVADLRAHETVRVANGLLDALLAGPLG